MSEGNKVCKAINDITSEMNGCPNINSQTNYKLCKRCIDYVDNIVYNLGYTPKESNKNKRKYDESWF